MHRLWDLFSCIGKNGKQERKNSRKTASIGPIIPSLFFIIASFFKLRHVNVSPTFIFIRAIPTMFVYLRL